MRLSFDLRAGLAVYPEPRDLVRGISQKYLQHLKGVRVAELGDEQKKDCVIEREWPVHAIILSCRAPECARSNAALKRIPGDGLRHKIVLPASRQSSSCCLVALAVKAVMYIASGWMARKTNWLKLSLSLTSD